MMIEYLKFTPGEWELIAHRLAAPDALAEALTDCCEGGTPTVPDSCDAVIACAERLLADGPKLLISSTLAYQVLKDAIEGSTYLCNLEEGTKERDAAIRHANRIEIKMRQHFGDAIEFPRS